MRRPRHLNDSTEERVPGQMVVDAVYGKIFCCGESRYVCVQIEVYKRRSRSILRGRHLLSKKLSKISGRKAITAVSTVRCYLKVSGPVSYMQTSISPAKLANLLVHSATSESLPSPTSSSDTLAP
jgi:hypothetical protein